VAIRIVTLVAASVLLGVSPDNLSGMRASVSIQIANGPVPVAGAFSADGRRFAIVRDDDSIVVRDSFGARRIQLEGFHRLPVSSRFSAVRHSIAFNAAGSKVLAGTYTTDGFLDHSGVVRARLYLFSVLQNRAQPSRYWNDVAMRSAAFSSDGTRLIVRSPELSDSPDTVLRIALRGGILEKWIPVNSLAPCNLSDGFQFSVPMSVRGGDDVILPGVACGKDVPGPVQLYNIPQRRALIAYQGSAGLAPVAIDADATTVRMIANGVLRFWGTQTGAPQGQSDVDVPMSESGKVIALRVGGTYAVVITMSSRAYPRSDPSYAITLYRTHDARAIARASGKGYVVAADIMSNGSVGVITDRAVDFRQR